MKKYILISVASLLVAATSFAQLIPKALNPKNTLRCVTMERLDEALKKDPGLAQKWKAEGERRYNAYLQRSNSREMQQIAGEIVIPVVFHLVDSAAALSWITDRDIYDQLEILNLDYGGFKADYYNRVIPQQIYSRLGRVPIRFVLARRTPAGAATTGIERRINTTPDRINIKSTANGGLDAWDESRYLNVWAGTFTGGDDGLLGISTFPFTTTEGPQGVVISIATLPYSSNTSRSYYASYSEGVTLVHEIGHYFYLWHTFGDEDFCNNNDFRIEPGWPLPSGAGPEGDDTPEEKGDSTNNADFGNPSMNYSDGCTKLPFGEMYGSFMNYFDDRAMFMFSDGMRKRIQGCIDLYRPGLKTSNGGIPPSAATDAYLVTATPRGLPERRDYLANNFPLTAKVRNYGTTTLTSVTLNVRMDGNTPVSKNFSINLATGADTVLSFGKISGATGTHVLTIYTSSPNNTTDAFTNNDTLQSFIFINGNTLTAPFTENFSGSAFPPAGWQIWNFNNNTTWTKSTSSGFTASGSATVQNFDYNGTGQLDDLVTPPINLGSYDSSILNFRVAYAVFDTANVSTWDGIEVYVSGNGGVSYQLAYKKTGNFLKTVSLPQKSAFTASPAQPDRWRLETINLTPYMQAGNNLIIKFRNTNAYGNNTYLDDINVSGYSTLSRDVLPVAITNFSDLLCVDNTPTPSVTVRNAGLQPVTSLQVHASVDNGTVVTQNWTGNLTTGQTTNVALAALNGLSTGNHVLTIFTSSPNGLTDQFPGNDTIRKSFYVFGKISSPVSEGFEGTTFPPAGWGISNPDGGITWQRTTSAASSGTASMVIRNFNDQSSGTTDKFVSSIITGNQAYDSVFVSFDYAYAPGSSPSQADTLEVQATTDCNQTTTTVWKNWGNQLATTKGNGNAFTPGASDWTNVKLYLTPVTGTKDFQINFVSKGNMQNNLYIDNINIYGKSLPALLKQKGYVFYPNPFHQQFILRTLEVPANLQNVSIYNTIGQLVWSKDYNGNAYTEMTIDLSPLSSGIYIVKLQYTDKKIIDRIVKL